MENKNKEVESRRSFLKKAAYTVPTVVALGQLTNPANAKAGSSCIVNCNDNFIGGGSSTGGNGNPGGTDESDAMDIFGNKK